MSNLENVSIVKKANVYFDGNVTSRTVNFEDGTTKSLGIMMEGEYTFGTEAAELMEILGGKCEVKLKGSDEVNTYTEGTSFNVDANSSFDIKVIELTDYCCHYIK